tara:strand:- start:355 stop:1545 length:1191 start_codon:yes stop_codon:yes gene_type:complete
LEIDSTSIEVTVPDLNVTITDFTIPDVTITDFTIPDVTITDFTIPAVTITDFTIPDVKIADFTIPDVKIADFTIPDVTGSVSLLDTTGNSVHDIKLALKDDATVALARETGSTTATGATVALSQSLGTVNNVDNQLTGVHDVTLALAEYQTVNMASDQTVALSQGRTTATDAEIAAGADEFTGVHPVTLALEPGTTVELSDATVALAVNQTVALSQSTATINDVENQLTGVHEVTLALAEHQTVKMADSQEVTMASSAEVKMAADQEVKMASSAEVDLHVPDDVRISIEQTQHPYVGRWPPPHEPKNSNWRDNPFNVVAEEVQVLLHGDPAGRFRDPDDYRPTGYVGAVQLQVESETKVALETIQYGPPPTGDEDDERPHYLGKVLYPPTQPSISL